MLKYRYDTEKELEAQKFQEPVKGTIMAGYKILTWIGKFYFSKWN